MSRVTAHVYAMQHTHYVLTPTACPHYALLLQYCTTGFLHPHFKNMHQDFSTPVRLAERKLV